MSSVISSGDTILIVGYALDILFGQRGVQFAYQLTNKQYIALERFGPTKCSVRRYQVHGSLHTLYLMLTVIAWHSFTALGSVS
jgi:hypothetical protein